ncbi:hypothetical protein ACQVA2_13800 [Citrobacter sp. OP27]
MENQNEPQDTNTIPAQNPVGGNGRSALAQAVLRATKREPAAAENHEEPEEGTGASFDDTASSVLGITDDSATFPGSTGEGESDEPLEDVWQFGGSDYTAVQVEEALKERETYERYNQSVKPLMETLTDYGNRFEKASLIASTECDNVIAEMNKALASGKLNSQQYQHAHMQLRDAKARKTLLEQAAQEETALRASALKKVREQNARQSVTALVRQGWKPEEITAVANNAQQVIGDKFADILSPDLLQVFRDAAELRNIKEQTAKRLKTKGGNVLKTTKQAPQRPQTATKPQAQTFGQKVWGDRYK